MEFLCCGRSRLSVVTAVAVLVLTGLSVLLAAPAMAHARLVATQPAAGETLAEAPDQVLLTYSEPVEESFSDVQVFDPAGTRVDARAARIEGPEIVVPMMPIADGGTYTVLFRVIGVDGHPVESRLTFTVEPVAQLAGTPAPEPSESTPADATTEVETAVPTGPTDPPALPSPGAEDATDEELAVLPTLDPTTLGESPAVDPQSIELEDAGPGTDVGLLMFRILDYVALVVIAAGLVGRLWLFTDERPGVAGRHRLMERVTASGGVALAVAAVMVFLFGLSSAAAEPLPAALGGELVGRFAGTRFGRLVLIQAAIGLGIAMLSASRMGRRGPWAAAALGVTAAALPGVWGHAGTTSPVPVAIVSDWTHVVAAAVWVGGLAVTLGVVGRGARDMSGGLEPVIRFSRLAGVAVWAVLTSGVVTALLHIGELSQLAGTDYGRLVIAKTALFGGIAGLGLLNRTRAIPELRRAVQRGASSAAGGRMLWRLGLTELAVMVVALGVAGGLASSIPAEAEAAARVEFIAAQLTDEATVNLTIDPAQPGSNVLHLYILGANGQPRPVDGARLSLTGAADLPVDLFVSGPGHYTVLDQTIPSAGDYLMAVEVDLDGELRRATATVTIR